MTIFPQNSKCKEHRKNFCVHMNCHLRILKCPLWRRVAWGNCSPYHVSATFKNVPCLAAHENAALSNNPNLDMQRCFDQIKFYIQRSLSF